MDVRCDRCQTEYEFDEARLTETGVAVRCTSCGNVFKVSRPVAAAAPIDLERPRQWKVRRNDGQVYALKDLPELQRWIVERRVSREDEVSLSGDAWRGLGSMPELASFFDVVEAAEQAQHKAATEAPGIPATMITPAASAPTPAWGTAAAAPKSTGSGTWDMSPQAFSAAPKSEPAWAAAPSAPAFDDDLAAEDLKHVRGSPWPGIVLALIVIGGASGLGYFVMKQMQKNQPPAAPAAPAAGGEPGAAAMPGAPTAPGPTGAIAPTSPVAAPGEPPTAAPSASGGVAQPAPVAAANPASPAPAAPTGAATGAGPKPTPGAPEAKAANEAEPAAAKAEAKPEKPTAKAEGKPEGKPEGGEAAKGGHDFNWYVSRGRKLLDTHPSQALAMFEQASQVNPNSPEPDSGRGIAYSNLEQWPKAITAFQAAIQKSPEFSEAVMGLAEAYRYKGEKAQALLYYRRYLELNPDGPDAPAAKAQIGSLKGE